jgi:hypothetical protein
MKSSSHKHKPHKHLDEIDNDNSSLSMITTKPIEWSVENELLLVDWCDTAQCYKWLHSRSHTKYSQMRACFTIPAIILSTISGTASFAFAGTLMPTSVYVSITIGTINICVGILTTVQQYLKISELNEGHRVSAIAWDKFARNIRIELAKSPAERMDAAHFLKINRQEYDRLMETSPSIHSNVIREFKETFQGKEGSLERRSYDMLRKPDICNTIVSANEMRHHWYLEQKPCGGASKLDAVNLDIKNKEYETQDAAEKNKELEEIIKVLTHQRVVDLKMKKVESHVNKFEEILGRKPLKEEMAEHFKEDGDITESVLDIFLSKHKDSIPSIESEATFDNM